MREGAANNSLPEASGSSSSNNGSSGTPILGATFASEEAITQASAAMVKGWRGLLAAAAKAQRRAKIAARNNSYSASGGPTGPANTSAVTAADSEADAVAGGSAVALQQFPATTAGVNSGLHETRVQDPPASSAAAAADDSSGIAAGNELQSVQTLASTQQQQQQTDQQVSMSAVAADELQHQPLQALTDPAAARSQQPAVADADVVGDLQQQPVAVASAAVAEQKPGYMPAATVAADWQQQQQHEVEADASGMLNLQQQEPGEYAGEDPQQHLLADPLLSEEHQQQQQVLAQVMNALEHSASLRQESGDPCDPGLLAADRRLAAATDVFRSLANSPEPDSLQEEQQEQLQEVNA
jgi:hypothetical protein